MKRELPVTKGLSQGRCWSGDECIAPKQCRTQGCKRAKMHKEKKNANS